MKIAYLISKILKKIQIPAIKNSIIDKRSKIASASHVIDTNIEKYSYVGNYCTIINANIGSFCSIADNVLIGGASHPIEWISTSPVFHEGRNIMKKNFSKHPYKSTIKTTIKNDVWIGNNSLIKSGITIENGAVVGMGSVITKDIGAYEIWAGNPAKLIRKRFNDVEIKQLLSSNWWDGNDNQIAKNSNIMNKKDSFIGALMNQRSHN